MPPQNHPVGTGACRVVRSWSASYPDPIRLAAGEPIELDGRTDVWDGHLWLWARNGAGRDGWIPDCIVSATTPATATESYTAMELTCRQGERLVILRYLHGWVFCRNDDGQEGWVPQRNIEVIDPGPAPDAKGERLEPVELLSIDHVQLAMPEGGEASARRFYGEMLGLDEAPKPDNLARRGGCWFVSGDIRVHLGVQTDFRPATKAHPAFVVSDLAALRARLDRAGFPCVDDEPLEGFRRTYTADPFGNRIELMEAMP